MSQIAIGAFSERAWPMFSKALHDDTMPGEATIVSSGSKSDEEFFWEIVKNRLAGYRVRTRRVLHCRILQLTFAYVWVYSSKTKAQPT